MEVQPAIALTAPAGPAPAGEDLPPWILSDDVPLRRVNRPRPASPPAMRSEPIHWGVLALMAVTAVGLLSSTLRAERTQSRELLPLVVSTAL